MINKIPNKLKIDEPLTVKINIEDIISKLYAKLTESQEGLGQEFKSVYFKNAWSLYES